jgi:hypothetical protein
MKREFVYTAQKEDASWFEAERTLVDSLRENGNVFRATVAAYPLEGSLRIPIHEVAAHLDSLTPIRSQYFGSFPDPNRRRSVSLGFVSGQPISAFVGCSGFTAHLFARPSADGWVYPQWWHTNLVQLLTWTEEFYRAAGYAGEIGAELELDGIRGRHMRFSDNALDAGTPSLEECVVARTSASGSDVHADPDRIALELTAAGCAAFGIVVSPDVLRDHLARR